MQFGLGIASVVAIKFTVRCAQLAIPLTVSLGEIWSVFRMLLTK